MNENIFRQKSIDKIKSPESLNDYIHITTPGVWLLLISIVLLLAGACIWGLFGHIDSTADAMVRVEDGNAVCYIDDNAVSKTTIGMVVKFGDTEAVIENIGEKTDRGYACRLETTGPVEDGIYAAKIVIKSFKPSSLILN